MHWCNDLLVLYISCREKNNKYEKREKKNYDRVILWQKYSFDSKKKKNLLSHICKK